MIGRKLGHFLVLEKLGEGGMGTVYKARDEKLGRMVALKVLQPELVAGEEWRRRFLREARAAAAVTHANIATIHDIGEDEGTVFIVMEYIDGPTLRALLRDRPLPLHDALRLGTAIATGLCRAHQSGVVHRDLKPENVIVSADGQPKILDFGLAKLLEERSGTGSASPIETLTTNLTQEGRVLGTAAYMSPEQARGDAVDPRTDVFSFGTMLFHMVTGVRPFARGTWAETMSAILNAPTPSATAIDPALPAELDRILSKCLEKEAADRYQDSRDLVVDLRRLLRQVESQAESPQVAPAEAVTRPTRRVGSQP